VAGALGPGTRLSRLALPPDATSVSQRAGVASVSCGATNSCVAVGQYVTAGSSLPFAATETRGLWSASRPVALPSDAVPSPVTGGPTTGLDAVACPAVGQCAAVGTYKTSMGFEAMIASASGGQFASATRIALPANAATAGQLAALFAVSCVHWGYCTAVGTYKDTSGNQLPLAVSERAGSWRASVSPALPVGALGADQLASLNGVDCEAAGACRAVGAFVDAGGFKSIALTQAAGNWLASAKAAVIAAPAGATSPGPEGVGLSSIDCTASDACVAVGQYATSSGYAAMSTSASHGAWTPSVAVAAPSTPATPGSSLDVLSSVSCITAGACTAVGTYGNTSTRLPFSATMTAGDFAPGVAGAVGLGDASTPLKASYGSVRCFSASACLVVGNYRTAQGTEGLLATPATVPDPPTAVGVARGNASIAVHWSAPAYRGLVALTGYVASASPGGQSCSSALTSCVIKGLSNGTRYHVTVVANNVIGSSVPSPPSVAISPATVPSAPTIVAIVPLTGALRLTLKAPTSNGGAGIATYDYTVDGGASWHVRQDGTTQLSLTISGLARHHTYHVSVRAVNGAGTGAAAALRVATTH
jgi:hypothetical protein